MTASTITSLAGAISKLLIRESSDADQLADVATVLRIIREAVRNQSAVVAIDVTITEIEMEASLAREIEEEAEREHEYHMRTSPKYRRAVAEGRD